MTRLIALALISLASTASTQTLDAGFFARLAPGTPVADRAGCTWQWAQGTIGPWGGWYQACGEPPQPRPAGCETMDPYIDAAHALECVLRNQPERPPLAVFQVGQQYVGAYPTERMIVIGLARSVDGVEVVTYQLTRATPIANTGDVAACRNDAAGLPSSCGVWLPATR